MRVGVLVLLVALVGCFQPATAPEKANERWLRIETEHFELATDLAPDDAKNAAQMLEQTRSALLATAWPGTPDGRLTARTSVVVFRDQLDFDHYGRHRFIGLFVPTGRSTIFLSGTPDRWERRTTIREESTTSVLRHELVHRLAASAYGRQPRWFAEGLAQFLETVRLAEDGKSATLGSVNLVALGKYKKWRGASVAEALAWKSDVGLEDGVVHALYGVSWLLVHFLFNTHPEGFAELQRKLGKGIEPGRAWSESFPDLTPATLDEQINHYSRFGKFAELAHPFVTSQVATVSKPITAADVLAIRAQFAMSSSRVHGAEDLRAESARDVERALVLEPGNAQALRLLRAHGGARPKDLVARLRAQVAQRPDDGEAWYFLGASLDGEASAEREAALRRAVALMPRSATAYNALAWVLVGVKRAEEALPFATKAALLAPWDAAILDTYAITLFALSRCPDALKTERRAADVIGEAEARDLALTITTRVAEYAKACGEPIE